MSLLIGGLYLFYGLDQYGIYYYVYGSDNSKRIFDTIFNSVFLFFNTFFCGVVILNLAIKKGEMEKEELEKGMVDSDTNYKHDLCRMILMFFANSILYIESFLIIYDILVPVEFIDLYYLISCLIINLIYAINEVVIKETKKLFCNPQNDKANRFKTYNTISHTDSNISGEMRETYY